MVQHLNSRVFHSFPFCLPNVFEFASPRFLWWAHIASEVQKDQFPAGSWCVDLLWSAQATGNRRVSRSKEGEEKTESRGLGCRGEHSPTTLFSTTSVVPAIARTQGGAATFRNIKQT